MARSDTVRAVVLLVDDKASNITRARRFLEKAGFEVFTASDAHAALELTAERTPHVIVSDYRMRGIDGLALCRRVRGTPSLAHLPFIIASAWDFTRAERETASSIGVDAIVMTTPDLDTVIAAIDALLRPTPGE